MSAAPFDDDLFDQVSSVVGPGTVIMTLTSKKLNRIIDVDRKGVLVETERSLSGGTGPQRGTDLRSVSLDFSRNSG